MSWFVPWGKVYRRDTGECIGRTYFPATWPPNEYILVEEGHPPIEAGMRLEEIERERES